MKNCIFITVLLFPVFVNAQNDPEALLLKDFHPKSIYQVPVTHVDKAAFPVIDMHSHPDAQSEAELDEWVQIMDATGIQKTIIMMHL